MASKMKSTLTNMWLVLGGITLIAGGALSYMFELTKAPIEAAKQEKLKQAIAMVTPAFDQMKTISVAPADGQGDSLTFYQVSSKGQVVGTAVKTWTDKGFSGRFWVIVGFDTSGKVINSNVVEHKETPGLGDKTDIAKSDWNTQFKGKDLSQFQLKVKKDGGQVDAITAATISSRAYCDALQRAYDAYMLNQKNTTKP